MGQGIRVVTAGLLSLTLSACVTALQTRPDALWVPDGAAAKVRAPQTVSIQNAYTSERVVKIFQGQGVTTTADLKQLTDTSIATLSRALDKRGVKVTPQAKKSLTLRVQSASVGVSPGYPVAYGQVLLEVTYLDGTKTTLSGGSKSVASADNVIDNSILRAVLDLLQHHEFLAYMNR
jgi:hypothetical protein